MFGHDLELCESRHMPLTDDDVTAADQYPGRRGPAIGTRAKGLDLADWDEPVDLLVLGTGAGGLSAAVTAANEGLTTLVLEKTEFLGGTTAYSAGTCWIPNNRFQRAAGVTDDALGRERLSGRAGGRQGSPRGTRVLPDQRPRGDRLFRRDRRRFWHSKTVVDYHPDVPGASLGGRALEPQTFDGRKLGKDNFGRVRSPVPEFALFGGTMMVRRVEVNQLLTLLQGSPKPSLLALNWAPAGPGTACSISAVPGWPWEMRWWLTCSISC